MKLITQFRMWARDLFHAKQSENELDAELHFDITQRVEANLRAGMSRQEAEREARREFGSVDLTKEECRDERGTQFFEQTWQDIRFGLRMLRKSPGFTATAILTLALGIGANTAIFSMMDTVILQNLPVRNPAELVTITSETPRTGQSDSFSYPMYQDLRDKNDAFDAVLAVGGAQMNVSYAGESEHVRGRIVSGNYFDVLGVHPWIGRLFTQADDVTPGANPVTVLSYGFWERRFGKDPTLVGKTILLNEHAMTVIGIAAPGFYGTELSDSPDVFVPLMMTLVFNPTPANRMQSHTHQWLTLMARRNPGVSMSQAQASIGVLYQRLHAAEGQSLLTGASDFARKQFFSRTNLMAGFAGQPGIWPFTERFCRAARDVICRYKYCAANFVREPRQPFASASFGSRPRNRGASCVGRGKIPPNASMAHGERADFCAWRRCGNFGGTVGESRADRFHSRNFPK